MEKSSIGVQWMQAIIIHIIYDITCLLGAPVECLADTFLFTLHEQHTSKQKSKLNAYRH